MTSTTRSTRRRDVPRRAAFALASTALALTALSGCAATGTSSSGETDGAAASTQAEGEHFNVAYLSASSANNVLASARTAMEKVASAENVTMTEFDAQFKPGEQTKQIRDVITSGKYQGIVIASIDGAGAIPPLKEAMDAGIQVAIVNQIIGTDLATADPQFPGVAVSALAPPVVTGQKLGELTVEACDGDTSCDVVFLYGIKGSPIDDAERQGFDSEIKDSANIQVVAEGEAGYLGSDEGRKAIQDILQTNPNPDVIVGMGDQGVQGAGSALKSAGNTTTKLISVGGSETALAGIRAGTWYGTVFSAPMNEGEAAMKGLVEAMRTGKLSGGIDTYTTLPDGGIVTSANVDQFKPQWSG